jgi:hypothetical protein
MKELIVTSNRIVKQITSERYGLDKKIQQDMLGSFVRHGLTQTEAESETLVQMLVSNAICSFTPS